MRILMINKFLYPNGGSETYIFKLGNYLESQGHEVQYFGMEHKKRCVGNSIDTYTTNINFHKSSKLAQLFYSVKTIYSIEARKKIRLVLNSFAPDVCHLNNFNYQLTPSIILEIVKWQKQTKNKCKIIYTAHDYQLVCPNHMLNNPNTHKNCTKCLSGNFLSCIKGKCIHGSTLKSMIGAIEASFWKLCGVYKYIDTIICCSEFMKKKIDSNPLLAPKTIVMHNFIDNVEQISINKDDYILYFGRYSFEKGIQTLIRAAKELPEIRFVFAGSGPCVNGLDNLSNVTNIGFKTGTDLTLLIQKARFSVCPSEWYENCPFSVMESQMYGTPVLGANIGGIPELITVGKTGELFTSGDYMHLKEMIEKLWSNPSMTMKMAENCKVIQYDDTSMYGEKLIKIYKGIPHQ